MSGSLKALVWCCVSALVVWFVCPDSAAAVVGPHLAATRAIPSPNPPQAQQPESIVTLRVVVTDAQQHSLAGATCSLIHAPESRVIATAVTNQEGVATFTAVPSGSYTLRVESNGFEPFIKNDVLVKNASPTDIKVSLAVASVAASVTIQSPNEEV